MLGESLFYQSGYEYINALSIYFKDFYVTHTGNGMMASVSKTRSPAASHQLLLWSGRLTLSTKHFLPGRSGKKWTQLASHYLLLGHLDESGLPDSISHTKKSLVYLGCPWNGKCLYILGIFGIFNVHLHSIYYYHLYILW